jgi:hypothetical protein
MGTQTITFNEETYEFNPYFPKGELAYGISAYTYQVNDDIPFTLQKVDNQFHLYYNGFFTMVTCSLDLTFDDIVKVISYIRNNKLYNLSK